MDKERSYRAECPACTCLFRFTRAEAVKNRYETCLTVTCPDEACQHIFAYTPKLHESQGEL